MSWSNSSYTEPHQDAKITCEFCSLIEILVDHSDQCFDWIERVIIQAILCGRLLVEPIECRFGGPERFQGAKHRHPFENSSMLTRFAQRTKHFVQIVQKLIVILTTDLFVRCTRQAWTRGRRCLRKMLRCASSTNRVFVVNAQVCLLDSPLATDLPDGQNRGNRRWLDRSVCISSHDVRNVRRSSWRSSSFPCLCWRHTTEARMSFPPALFQQESPRNPHGSRYWYARDKWDRTANDTGRVLFEVARNSPRKVSRVDGHLDTSN